MKKSEKPIEKEDEYFLLEEVSHMAKSPEEIQYIENLWGTIPCIDVKCGTETIGQVLWNENLKHYENHGEDTFTVSLGLTQLKSGAYIKIWTIDGEHASEIISKRDAIELIIDTGRYNLIDKFKILNSLELIEQNDHFYLYMSKDPVTS